MSVDCDTLDAVGKEKKDCKGDFLYMDNEDDIKAERLGKDESFSLYTEQLTVFQYVSVLASCTFCKIFSRHRFCGSMSPPSVKTASKNLLSLVFVSNKDRDKGVGARCSVKCSKVTKADKCGK